MKNPGSIATVIGALRIAAHCLADKLGVSVTIGGSQACTDGSVIRLPDLPADSAEAALLARGFVDHEAAHIRLTDFSIPVRPWLNLLEDIRIEAEQGREFPGCAVNMRQLVEHLKGLGHFRGDRKSPLSCLMAWASCHGRTTLLKQPLGEIATAMERASRTAFGDRFCAAFAQLIDQVGSCRSTADCDGLARQIENLIQNPPQPEEAEPSAESCASSQEPSSPPEPQDSAAPGSEGDPDPDTESSALNTDQDTSALTITERQRQTLAQASIEDGTAAVQNLDVGQLLRQALDAGHQQGLQQGILEIIPDTYHHGPTASGSGDQAAALKVLGIDGALRQTARLRAQLSGLLQARRRQRSAPRQSGQRLDPSSLHRIACPNPDTRVFSSRAQRADPNTAVLILGDRSGSMGVEKMRLALQSAFVTAQSLDSLPGIGCAVGFFPWGEHVAEIKGFDQKLRPARFVLGAGGSTPMDSALLWAAMQLTHRREPRKIVIVLTDGQPDDVPATRAALTRIAACGIESYGIGIQNGSILSWMPTGARVIQSCDELPQALVGVLTDALLGQRFK